MASPDSTAAATAAAAAFTLQGNLFISAQIERIFAQKAREQREQDYISVKGEKLRNKIATAYSICMAEWRDFKAQMERTDLTADERMASVQRFAVHFFQYGLGYNEPSAVGTITIADSADPESQLIYPVNYVIYQTSAQAQGMEKLPLVVVPPVTDQHERSDLDTKLTYCAVLDAQKQQAVGEKKRSPTGMLQRLLNAADGYNWGFAFNGYALRLQREAVSLSGLNYAEFNLESIFTRENQADFAHLYLMLHVSRSRVDEAGNNVWEQWRQECREVGQPARDKLSQSLSEAMVKLGNGFLQWHLPFTTAGNEALKAKIRSGELTAADFNQQLIRLVYRLLFIFCLEERDCLLTTVPSAGQSVAEHQEARQRYLDGYALKRFVPQALKTYFYENDYADAWDCVRIVLKGLAQGEPRLALPALGGLFSTEQCADLAEASVSNSVFYETMRLLRYAYLDGHYVLIDYRNIDTEEFGSMYEGLLELVPEVREIAGEMHYALLSVSGNERKSSGSYYTPDALVQSLIHTALDPVIESKLKANPQEPEQALLSLKVIDPTCGSGHFLLAAARRIAKLLAEVRAHGGEVSPQDSRRAMHDVIANCIYGVDLNPMAIELARMGLWLEGFVEDTALSFLDDKLKVGNAILGVMDVNMPRTGIPAAAYAKQGAVGKHLTTVNNKEFKAYFKDHDQANMQGSMLQLIEDTVVIARPTLLTAHNSVESLRNEERKAAYAAQVEAQLRENPEYVACQLYMAAFMSIKTPENEGLIPTSNDVFAVYDASNLLLLNEARQNKIAFANEVCAQAHVFHWPLMFPEVLGDNGSGFDCVLGNPPWEKPKVEDVKWFAAHQVEEIANAQNADKRKKLIKKLATGSEHELQLYAEYQRDLQFAQCLSNFVHLKDTDQGRFTLTGKGDCNLFALIAELGLQLRHYEADAASVVSAAGLVVPAGIITDNGSKDFCQEIFSQHEVASAYHFVNAGKKFFPSVDERYSFVLLTLRSAEQADCAFYLTQVAALSDLRRHVSATYEDFARFNPNTHTAVLLRTDYDLQLCRKIYARAPVLVNEALEDEGNPWQLSTMRMFDMSNDSYLFVTKEQLQPEQQYLPLYEAKLFWQFDHRFNTYVPVQQGKKPKVTEVSLSDKRNSAYAVTPQYWVPAHLVMDKFNNAIGGGGSYINYAVLATAA